MSCDMVVADMDVGPGHTPILYAGTEVIEFSPTEELHDTLEVVERNMAAAG